MIPPPIVVALLAAAEVRRDPASHRCDVLGVVHALNLPLPVLLDLAVYFALTGCHGPVEVDVELVDPDDEVIAGGTLRVAVTNPLAVAEGDGRFNGVLVDRPGEYRVRLSCRGDVLAERKVIVGVTERPL